MKRNLDLLGRGLVYLFFGIFWGDEGKGKALAAMLKNFYAVARYQGGNNAGHTLFFYVGGVLKKFVAHIIPSGVVSEFVKFLLIGNDVVMNPVKFLKEVEEAESLGLEVKKRLKISKIASFIDPYHIWLDTASEWYKTKNGEAIGTTKTGNGPAYANVASRDAIKIGMVHWKDFEERVTQSHNINRLVLEAFIADGFPFKGSDYEILSDDLNIWLHACYKIRDNFQIVDMLDTVEEILASGKNILAEGAQGAMLDPGFGDYPMNTSSITTPHGVFHGLGIGPLDFGPVTAVTKWYLTRVGTGEVPSQMDTPTEESFQKAGDEHGATTGRPRRCGWMDFVVLRYVIGKLCKGFGEIEVFLTKTDITPDDVSEFFIVTEHKLVDGSKTKDLQFPLSLIAKEGHTMLPVKPWRIKTGLNKFYGPECPFELQDFVNIMQNELHGLNAKVKYIGTGPGIDDWCEVE